MSQRHRGFRLATEPVVGQSRDCSVVAEDWDLADCDRSGPAIAVIGSLKLNGRVIPERPCHVGSLTLERSPHVLLLPGSHAQQHRLLPDHLAVPEALDQDTRPTIRNVPTVPQPLVSRQPCRGTPRRSCTSGRDTGRHSPVWCATYPSPSASRYPNVCSLGSVSSQSMHSSGTLASCPGSQSR